MRCKWGNKFRVGGGKDRFNLIRVNKVMFYLADIIIIIITMILIMMNYWNLGSLRSLLLDSEDALVPSITVLVYPDHSLCLGDTAKPTATHGFLLFLPHAPSISVGVGWYFQLGRALVVVHGSLCYFVQVKSCLLSSVCDVTIYWTTGRIFSR